MKHKGTYIVLFVLAVVTLALPMTQQYGQWLKLKPLKGVTVTTKQPELTYKSFMSGEFQKQEEKYLSENLGFREWLIRCYNQTAWSLFHKSQNKTIYIGKDKWIFNDFAIKHHYGQMLYDYVKDNDEAIKKMKGDAVLLCLLQNILKEYGVTFFVCLAPSKDLVCEQYLPKVNEFTRPAGILAIDHYPSLFDSLGINYIDFSTYFMSIKDTVSYPLYLKSSSHWSNQAAVYAADTLFRYMEALGGFNMHNLDFGDVYLDKTHYQDADLEEVMNLIWPIESGKNLYTHFKIDGDTTAIKPKWLSVGDSYFWGFQYNLPLDALFETHHYWYYNKTVHDDKLHKTVDEVDIVRELLSSDVVMLVYSPCNLFDLNRQFLTRSLFGLLYEESVIQQKLENVKQKIRNSKNWYASLEQKAAASGQDLELVIDDNARYMLYGSPSLYFKELASCQAPTFRSNRAKKVADDLQDPRHEAYRKRIGENKEWLESIKEKAKTQHITLDEAIEKDIDWLIKTKDK